MKYIIDVPDTQEITYYTEQKMVCLKVNEGIVASEIYIDAEPYTEPDRKAIEDEVWGFAQKVYEVIDDDNDIFFGHTYHEMKERYETWLKQKDKIRVEALQKKQQAQAEQETAKVEAQTALIKAQNEAEITITKAKAEAEANRVKAASITPELIKMKEAEARYKHGWVTVQGADATVVKNK